MEDKQKMQKWESDTDAIERTRSGKVFTPPVDIIEKENEIILFADMPGVDEKEINIVLEKNILTITGKVDQIVPENFEQVYAEYESGDYQRSFTITDKIDQEKIAAEYKYGVLKLTLPKAEPVKPKKIVVKTE